MIHDPWTLLLMVLIVVGAAAVKGAIGFGFPLVAVPLLSVFMGPRVAVPLVAIPTLVSNFIMMRRGSGSPPVGGRPATAPLLLAAAGVIVGTIGGARLVTALDTRLLSLLVGGVTLVYVAATVFHLTARVPRAAGERLAPVVGLVAGVMGGSTGIFAPLMASYLHLLRLAKQEFVFWITVMFFTANVVQVASYLHLGLYAGPVLAASLLACVPMAAGTGLGILLQDRLPQEAFTRIMLAVVCVASLSLLARGMWR